MGSQVVGKDRSDYLGKKQLGKLGEKEEPAIERRREYANLGLIYVKRTSRLPCLGLTMTDQACREA